MVAGRPGSSPANRSRNGGGGRRGEGEIFPLSPLPVSPSPHSVEPVLDCCVGRLAGRGETGPQCLRRLISGPAGCILQADSELLLFSSLSIVSNGFPKTRCR